jgi:hypothetical protein
MKEDKHFRDWYKRRIESHSERPPEEIWEKIQDDLDIDNAWQHISAELKHQGRIVFLRHMGYAAAAAAAVILFILMLVPSQIAENNYYKHTQTVENKTYPAPLTSIGEAEEINTAATRNNRENRLREKMISSLEQPLQGPELIMNENESVSNTDNTPEPGLTHLNSGDIRLAYNQGNPKNIIQTERTREIPKLDNEEPPVRSFYVGTSGQFSNSWLLSNKTLYSIRESPYSSVEPARNNAISIMAGLSFTDRFDMQFESQFNNNSGQIYNEYVNGDFITNQIQLKYTSFILSGRYRFIKESKHIPVSHHIVVGTYGSYLQHAYQDINQNTENIRGSYKNYDLGLIIGYEIDSKLTRSLVLSTGARIDPGLINIFKGSDDLPADFNRTYTTSLGVQVSLKYVIR